MNRYERDGRFHKLIRAEVKAVDTEKFTVEAVVSTEAVDRDGDIIRAAGWDLSEFNTHSPLLASHDYGNLTSQIGVWDKMTVVKSRKTLEGTARYFVGDGNEQADWGFKLAEKGVAAFSVGFQPDMAKATELDGDGWFPSFEFNGQKLWEVSQVTMPANPEALQLSKGLISSSVLQDVIRDWSDIQDLDDVDGDDLESILRAAMGEIKSARKSRDDINTQLLIIVDHLLRQAHGANGKNPSLKELVQTWH